MVRLLEDLLLANIPRGRRGWCTASISKECFQSTPHVLLFLDSSASGLKHDRAGLVSVRKGSNSGFGFTIYPGGSPRRTEDLDSNHIIVGQVLEGMDIIEQMNKLPVVGTAKVNYKAFGGGSGFQEGPSRACRYGGSQLYCNENKPLQKLTMYRTGLL